MILVAVIPAYLFLALIAYHIEKRLADSEMPALCAAFWPMRLAELAFLASFLAPIAAVFGAAWVVNRGFGWLFGKTDAAVDRMVDGVRGKLSSMREKRIAKRLERRTRMLAPPRITIPDGAALGSEEYRKLKPMIESFERGLPVHERE